MCKHVAATLYGIGARLDEKPELLFQLRAVDAGDLLADLHSTMPSSKPVGDRVLAAADVSALFGLDLAESGVVKGGAPTAPKKRTPSQRGGAKRLGTKEAEKLVADVVARIGKHLVM